MKKIIFVALMLCVGCSSKTESGSRAAEGAAAGVPAGLAKVGAPAPQFTLPRVPGKENFNLSSVQGKVVLLDFWATWCPPCRMSIPAIERLYAQYKDQPFTVVGISLDNDFDTVAAYVKENNIPYTVVYGGDHPVSGMYSVRGIPTMYLLDKKGVVQKRYSGFALGMEKDIEKDLKPLLSSSY